MGTTEPQEATVTELTRIAWLSKLDSQTVFHSLMHHINVESLRSCYDKLDGKKAVGTDGINKEYYGKNLSANLEDLITRMKKMAYRPGPVREVQIPKEGKPGATRPLGISNFEDKLVQKRVQEILESIYDPLFLECSYGFRLGRSCHDALKDLDKHLFDNEVETVLDVDLSNFFGRIDRKLLEEMLRIKIKDTKFLRYINRMFKAGVLSEGELKVSEEGVVQGSCCSPVLANIYAHYVIDTWLERTIKPICKGPIRSFRFADDLVTCCRYEEDAEKIKKALITRLAEFNLKLNEEKTKLVKFSMRKARQGEKQETFNFLGFTFYLGKARSGTIIPKMKTEGKRLRAKLKRVNQWSKTIRNKLKLKDIWQKFCSKIRGHIQYYGISHNTEKVSEFVMKATRIMFKWLNRRSQRKSFSWEKFREFIKKFPLPAIKVHHRLF